ncbi:MAG: hypothetical protein LAO21_03025 [Acidobacteriia bacterium]|nr:hypothetical protein [Terriglobia bacterium]
MTRIRKYPRLPWVGLLLALALAPALRGRAAEKSSPDGPETSPTSILFSKELQQGQYERFKISIDQQGRGKFEAKPRDGELMARDLQVSPDTMRRLLASFEAAQFLSSTREYESPAKVADMGMKTIALEQNGRSREVRFNYTFDKNMATIADLFGGLVTTQLRLASLENAKKYDKLGLPDELNALQAELNNHWLVDAELLIPVLTEIANNRAFFNVVQRKAHQLILQIESATPSARK